MTRSSRWAADNGTVLTFALAGVLLVVAVALVFADTSSLFMRRSALLMVADDAAVAAANAVDVQAIYLGGVGDTLQLDPQEAVRLAQASIDAVQDARLRDVQLDEVQVSGDSVSVLVSAAIPSPIGVITGNRDLRIRARATASMPTRF